MCFLQHRCVTIGECIGNFFNSQTLYCAIPNSYLTRVTLSCFVSMSTGFTCRLGSTSSTDIGTTFIALYVFFFSSLICCYECALAQVSFMIVQNFGFMYNPVGRTIFLVFVAVLLFQLSDFGKACFAFLLLMLVVQLYVNFAHPKYESYIKKLHYRSHPGLQNQNNGGNPGHNQSPSLMSMFK
jgi:COPI associated protein